MKKIVITIVFLHFFLHLTAQESQTAYNFLRLPVSAHAAALGGENISLDNEDPSMIFHNPALISNVSSRQAGLNFMSYMEGARTASAAYIHPVSDRATWGVSAQYMSYGDMKETNADNEILGDFSAKDIALAGTFCYTLSARLAGAITGKFITSYIGSYNSLGVAVDLGLNYYLPEEDFSLSVVARNLGGQVKAYDEEFDRIPFDLQMGASKRFGTMPFRFHATLTRLTDWDEKFLHHLVIGADLLIGDQFYLAGGYNFRRHDEMRITASDETSSSYGAGLSVGAGFELTRFRLCVSYGKYHVSSKSLQASVSFNF